MHAAFFCAVYIVNAQTSGIDYYARAWRATTASAQRQLGWVVIVVECRRSKQKTPAMSENGYITYRIVIVMPVRVVVTSKGS